MGNKLKKNPEDVGPKRREYYDASPEEQALLDKIAMLESSGGKDMAHDEIQSPNSIHSGDSAYGTFGLMPNTIEQITKVSPRMGIASPELRSIKGLPADQQLEEVKKNPDLEQESALNLLRMIKRQKPTEEQAAYMWQYGHNKVPPKEKVEKSDRGRKFKALKK